MTDEQRALREELAELAGDPARDRDSPPDKWALLARGYEDLARRVLDAEARLDLVETRVRLGEGDGDA